jgi:hypothetical protein
VSSHDSVTPSPASTTRTELIEEAFGGEKHFWPFRRRRHGISALSIAWKRISVNTPFGMPPKERLLLWDSKRPEVTVKLFKFVGRQAVPGLTTAAIAKKWIANLGTDGVSAGLGDGLDNDNTENTYENVGLRSFPRNLNQTTQSHPTSDDEWDLYFYAETQELRLIETRIEAWLGSQPIPKGYVRCGSSMGHSQSQLKKLSMAG